MIRTNHGTPLKPHIESDGRIRITKAYGAGLCISGADMGILESKLVGRSMCPEWLWFEDTPDVRRILRLEAGP